MNKDNEDIIFITKDEMRNKMINKNIDDSFTNTSIAIMKDYKCLTIENITKLLGEDFHNSLKSVLIFNL